MRETWGQNSKKAFFRQDDKYMSNIIRICPNNSANVFTFVSFACPSLLVFPTIDWLIDSLLIFTFLVIYDWFRERKREISYYDEFINWIVLFNFMLQDWNQYFVDDTSYFVLFLSTSYFVVIDCPIISPVVVVFHRYTVNAQIS